MHAAAGDVKVFRRTGTRPDGDTDIEREGRADDDVGQGSKIHRGLLVVQVVLAVQRVHAHGVDKHQYDIDVDRALLREPETELEAANLNLVERLKPAEC